MYVIAQLTSIQILLIGIQSSDVRLPPTITKSPVKYKVFRFEDEITLECEASGSPAPQYEWFKNDVVLSIPGISGNLHQVKEGTLRIKPATSLDEGYYQCKAFNQYGTSVSNVSYLRRAVLEHFTGSTGETFESGFIEEGQPFSFDCNKAKVFPRPLFSWALAKKEVDAGPQDGSQGTVIPTSKRIQVDEHGNLHFAYVIKADAPKDLVYKCNMYNPHLDVMMGGSYSRLKVKSSTKPGKLDSQPIKGFSSNSPVVALEGKNVSIRCFFSGYPEPEISWTRHGRPIASERHVIGSYNTDLTIRKVNRSDGGSYVCSATNPSGSNSASIVVEVQAAPVFHSMRDQPHNRNVTEGNDVTIYCRAYADPSASVVWYRNGKEINFDDHPKYRVSDDRQQLKISNLCKDCTDSSSDLAVIQCNASNVHGYAFADGYINVLKKTSIIIRPENVKVREGTLSARFDCMAQSDDSTPVTINWYKVETADDDDDEVEVQIRNISNRNYIGHDSSLYFHVNNFTEWIDFLGQYRCVAKNGYSIASAMVALAADNLELPPAPPLATAGLGDLWWIFLIVALILLLLILLTCCCICLQQNKGNSYPVDEKERKNGNNPEKELAEGAFHDYQRPEGEPLKGSRASLSSSIKIESEEEASLSEYGDIDAGKFTEDGSFIGDYGADKKRANANAQTEKA